MFRHSFKKKHAAVAIILCFLMLTLHPANALSFQSYPTDLLQNDSLDNAMKSTENFQDFSIDLSFGDATIEIHDNVSVVRVPGTNLNKRNPGQPVIPAYVECFSLPFGSSIVSISYNHSDIEIIPVTEVLASGSFPSFDGDQRNRKPTFDPLIYQADSLYPSDWIDSHTGGGLDQGDHTTFFVLRVYPARYNPVQSEIHLIKNISVTVQYQEPAQPMLNDPGVADLVIITPKKFQNPLKPLVSHKQDLGIDTKVKSVEEIYNEMPGRDKQEQIKFFIKQAIEEWGVTYVLLVGGLSGQTTIWNLPVRLSRVVPPTEQEYPEQSFISDLYYADIYDSTGGFSSWDSNDDDVFSVWNATFHETMDLYPDVYLGRLPCRCRPEVVAMVQKIINYEIKSSPDDDWFSNLVLVAGDAYADEMGFNEGELIGERAVELMPEFNPLRVYAKVDPEEDINRDTVNAAMNQGAGFAYFCGHGSVRSWSTHYPPDGKRWTSKYTIRDMLFLKNVNKYPVTIVGGCHNGQFDVTLMNMLLDILEDGIEDYFSKGPGPWGDFWFNQWIGNCWAWMLTSRIGGGAIATIANTGLGTHGENDQDYNGVADYLEVLDGWLELRFLQLYGEFGQDDLGMNHAQTMTEYLHRFLDDDWTMDTKMVQQWELFGDPSLKIGGYQ